MDPLTQGLIGAAAAQAVFGGKLPKAWLVGAASGVAPDLDVLIQSSTDPLLGIQYHRHFTHALAFIPIGGAICALPWMTLNGFREQWQRTLGASLAGYGTHGLLDACTTYGTQLFWPFSDTRLAWDWISIIDPIFTLTLLIGVIVAAILGRRKPAVIALALAAAYLGLGAVQRSRAMDAQQTIAEGRGHQIERSEVFPTFANQWVWRSLYQAEDQFYADRIRVPWFGNAEWTPGESVSRVSLQDLPPLERRDDRIVRDFLRFSWFSDGWVANPNGEPSIYGDVRYSMKTDAFEPIWGIRFDPDADIATSWVSRTTERELRLANLWDEIIGRSDGYRPVSANDHSGN